MPLPRHPPRARLLLLLLLWSGRPVPLPGQETALPRETGRFILHKFEQPVGREDYTLTLHQDGLALSDTFEFTDRGTRVPLGTLAGFAADLSPRHLVQQGRSSRHSTLDLAVDVRGDSARVRIDSVRTTVPVAGPAFAIAGYAPIAMQQLLIRYWERHDRPDTIAALPEGRIAIVRRGLDSLTVRGQVVQLTRYVVSGLIWGRETLWLDSHGLLIAAVTIDAEFDHFEAVRDGYQGALAFFVARAADDAARALAELTRSAAPAGGPRFALVGATVIDGTGGPPLENATVLVERGRIRAVGTRVRVPRGVPRIDATGRTVLPGLWDMHAHYEQVEWGPIYLASGVTTVRDVGNELGFITSVRDAIAAGRGIGPRLLLAGIVDGDSPQAVGVERAATPAEGVAEVRKYHAAGFQQIKIYSSVTPEVVRAITAEAHRLRMTVTGHIPRGMDGYQGVDDGMDQINHVSYLRPMMLGPADSTGQPPPFDSTSAQATRAVRFLKEHGTVVDPTLALFELLLHPASEPVQAFEPGVAHVAPPLAEALAHTGVPAADSARASARFAEYLTIVGLLHRGGVPIVAGTDQAVPGYSLHRELELYVQAGFTPMEAIQAATIVPARVMGLDREVGTIARGKRADLVVVDGNPLQDFEDLRRVWLVVANGQRYDPAALWRSVGFTP